MFQIGLTIVGETYWQRQVTANSFEWVHSTTMKPESRILCPEGLTREKKGMASLNRTGLPGKSMAGLDTSPPFV